MTEYVEWGGMKNIRFLDKFHVTLTDVEGKEVIVPEGHAIALDRHGNMTFVPMGFNEAAPFVLRTAPIKDAYWKIERAEEEEEEEEEND